MLPGIIFYIKLKEFMSIYYHIAGTYKWIPACLSQNSIPPGALLVGRDVDDAEIYAGRARHEGDIVPAKVIPSKNACYISFNGEEILKDQFEVSQMPVQPG